MKKVILPFLSVLLISCQDTNKELSASQVIDKAIEAAGGENYNRASVEFEFRNKHYSSMRRDGLYEFTRTQTDSSGAKVKDVLSNEGFVRYIDGQEQNLPDSLVTSYSESVNSVHYFVQLPYGLNSPAVIKELKGEDEIKGKSYYEIQVTFKQEGGGTDHEDIYMYWIDKEDFSMDYLAYRFYVNDGGIRFRVAVDPRVKKGIRFVDYINYKTGELDTPLTELDDLYEAGKLKKVSEIRNKILKVEVN